MLVLALKFSRVNDKTAPEGRLVLSELASGRPEEGDIAVRRREAPPENGTERRNARRDFVAGTESARR